MHTAKLPFLFLLLIIFYLTGCEGSRTFPPVQNVTDFPQTDFVASFEQPFDASQNQLFCTTLGYAWGEIVNEIGGQLKIQKEDADLTFLNLNSHQNTLAKDEINTSIEVNGFDLIARAEFSKSLPFEFDFERNNQEIVFDGKAVHSFGMNGRDRDMSPQVDLIYYKNEHDFALKLLPKEKEHEIFLILPKTAPTSFQSFFTSFQAKIVEHSKIERTERNYWKYSIMDEDLLSIPVFNFNLEKDFETLAGNVFRVVEKPYTLVSAYQRIALILDEKGAKIESEAEINVATEAMEELPQPKRMIFDQPFVIAFKRIDAEVPYFMAWVQNTELMVLK